MAERRPRDETSGQEEVSFGARLRGLREAAGLTQEELALRARLTARGISDLERGRRRRPYPQTVRSLSDALGLTEDERAALLASVPKRDVAATVAEAAGSEAEPLPVPGSSLVGRERALREIAELLRGPQTRLLTLTGPGGIGKTRLALEVARDAEGSFSDGVAFVPLAPLGDADLVVPTISQALGLKEAVRPSPLDALCDHLRHREMLLVLDNFEHVAEAAPEAAVLIRSCTNLTALVTSRAPLRVRGEQEYPVSPLALPSSTRSPVPEEVAASPSGSLFLERARAVSPAFGLTGENAGAVASICWRLDGLPLALELAAARTRFLDPRSLLGRLDRALEAGGTRDLPHRQRTMRATLDWSHDLLSEDEKVLFRRLSVFAGGFDLEAAEVVGGVEDVGDALDLLGRLVEQSLVLAEASSGEMRYRMLEPVRQYAREKLEERAQEAEEVRRRHALYYLALGERVGLKLKGPEQPKWLGRLETELDNLRAAIHWSIEHGEVETLARTAWAMWKFWWLRGHRDENRRRMQEALAREPDLLPISVRAKLLYVEATLAQASGDFGPARPLIEESLALFRRLEDRYGIAESLATAGLVALGQERYEEGLALLEESADIFLELGRKRAAGSVLGFATKAPLAQGDTVRARRLAERALSLAREPGGARDVLCSVLHPLAAVARAEGDNERAVRLLEESLTISVEIGDEGSTAYCLEGLAAIAADEGELEHAARLWGTAEALLEKIEVVAYPHALARSLHQQQVADARARLEEEAWRGAWAQGRAMALEQAIEYALGEHTPSRAHEDESRRVGS